MIWYIIQKSHLESASIFVHLSPICWSYRYVFYQIDTWKSHLWRKLPYFIRAPLRLIESSLLHFCVFINVPKLLHLFLSFVFLQVESSTTMACVSHAQCFCQRDLGKQTNVNVYKIILTFLAWNWGYIEDTSQNKQMSMSTKLFWHFWLWTEYTIRPFLFCSQWASSLMGESPCMGLLSLILLNPFEPVYEPNSCPSAQ